MHLCAQLVRDLSTDNRSIESVVSKYYETEEPKIFRIKKKSEEKVENNPSVLRDKVKKGKEDKNENEYSQSGIDSESSEDEEDEEEEDEEGGGGEIHNKMSLKEYEEIKEKYKRNKMIFSDISTLPQLPSDGGIDFISQRTLDLWNLYSIVRQSGC